MTETNPITIGTENRKSYYCGNCGLKYFSGTAAIRSRAPSVVRCQAARSRPLSVQAVESELRRLDVQTTHSRPEGISVYSEDDLPAGWLRVSDGTGEAFGLASEIAARLAEVPVTGEVTDDGRDLDWEAAWDALGEFADHAPQSTQDWPSDRFKVEQLEEGTCNDAPASLIVVETNAGTRYAAGPHGVYACALSDWFNNCGKLAETREAAIEVGCEFAEGSEED